MGAWKRHGCWAVIGRGQEDRRTGEGAHGPWPELAEENPIIFERMYITTCVISLSPSSKSVEIERLLSHVYLFLEDRRVSSSVPLHE